MENTWTAYQSDLEHVAQWCAGPGIAAPVPADPHVVAADLTDYTGELATSTLARRLYPLSAIHRLGGHPSPAQSPEVQTVCSGIKHTHRTAPATKAATLTTIIIQLVEVLGDRPKDVCDRALLLIGCAGAFRHSELVAVDIADLTETADGLQPRHPPVKGRPGRRRRHRRPPLRLEPRDVSGPRVAGLA